MVSALGKILVTGGGGFIGRPVLATLSQLGFQVLAPSSRELDFLNYSRVNEYLAFNRPERLLHLAWLTTPGIFFESPENLKWVEATLGLLRAFAQIGGRRFVGIGTCFEECEQETFYGNCKRVTAHLATEYAQRVGLEFAWARLFHLYGPYEKPERLIPSIIHNLLSNREVLCSSGEQIRDYLYVEDCAHMLVQLLLSDVTGIVEIASGSRVKLGDFIFAFAGALGKSHLVRLGALPDRVGEPKIILPQNKVRWQPMITREDGIKRTIAYWSK